MNKDEMKSLTVPICELEPGDSFKFMTLSPVKGFIETKRKWNYIGDNGKKGKYVYYTEIGNSKEYLVNLKRRVIKL